MIIILVGVLLLATVGCGKKADPVPVTGVQSVVVSK